MSWVYLFLITFVILLLSVAMMAIGVMARRPAITGSCGGLGNIPGVSSDCGGTCRRNCPRKQQDAQ